MMCSSNGLTTAQIASDLGVDIKTLQRWAREGLLDVGHEGSGRGRRIVWTEEAVEQAARVRDRVAGDNVLAVSLGPDLAAALKNARAAQRLQAGGDVVVATADSARIFRRDASLADVLKRVHGRTCVVLGSG